MADIIATDKIQKIAEHIRSNVLDPVQKEKEQILQEAIQEKARIISEARKEAADLLEEVTAQCKAMNNSVHTALRTAAKQAVPVLKYAIENEVFKQIIEEPTKELLNEPDILKKIIMEITRSYIENNFSGDIEVLVSKENREKLKHYIQKDASKKIKGGLSLSEESGISGCKVIFKEQRIMLDFSDEAVTELLSKYVRAELRSFLFK